MDEARRVGAAAICAYLHKAAGGRQREAEQGRPNVLQPPHEDGP